jgi:cbb3-type cytochrome oxidase subunit 3
MSEQQNERSSNGIYLIIILLLLACLAVFAYLYSVKRKEFNNCNNENIILKSDMQGMNDMMQGYVGNMSNDLKKDFKNMLATYDKLIEKDKSKADSLNIQKAQIQTLLDKLNSNKKLSASELYKLRKENETLRGIMRSYVRQIDSLNTLNIKLTSDLDQTTTKLTETSNERDQFKKEAEEKSEKIKLGSRLQAYGFKSEALRMKLNKTTETTEKAKNAIQFRSSFTISENSLTTPGKKSVYMQIIGPNGEVFQASPNNKFNSENGTMVFSDKKDIDYSNQSVDVTIYYDLKSETATKGNYKVKVYCDGTLIGTDNFSLK